MVNMVTGHGKDEETMCAEYKVSSVQVQKISNQFKTEVKPKEHQAEDGIRDSVASRGLGDVYKRQTSTDETLYSVHIVSSSLP